MPSREPSGWPVGLRPGAVRFARASGHFDETIAFYRDMIGLPVVAEFTGSFGEDGVVFGLPDTAVQLEIVRAREPDDAAGSFDQLVFYLDDAAAARAAVAPLEAAGSEPVGEPHPYWAARGGVVHRDPDGRDVVFAPWVFGRDPEPG